MKLLLTKGVRVYFPKNVNIILIKKHILSTLAWPKKGNSENTKYYNVVVFLSNFDQGIEK